MLCPCCYSVTCLVICCYVFFYFFLFVYFCATSRVQDKTAFLSTFLLAARKYTLVDTNATIKFSHQEKVISVFNDIEITREFSSFSNPYKDESQKYLTVINCYNNSGKYDKEIQKEKQTMTLTNIYSSMAYYSEMVSTRIIRPHSDRCGSVFHKTREVRV